MEAVKQGTPVLGLRSKTHVVLVSFKRAQSELANHQHLGICRGNNIYTHDSSHQSQESYVFFVIVMNGSSYSLPSKCFGNMCHHAELCVLSYFAQAEDLQNR